MINNFEELKDLPLKSKQTFICEECQTESESINKTLLSFGKLVCKKCRHKYFPRAKYTKLTKEESLKKYNKYKESMLEKYGVENTFARESTKEKIKQTNLAKYGVENPTQNSKIREKQLQTKQERYGDENYNNREKSKQTCLANYGVEYNQQNKEIQQQSMQTKIEKYGGVLNDSLILREKARQTKLEKYGSETFTNREKAAETMLKNMELIMLLKWNQHFK